MNYNFTKNNVPGPKSDNASNNTSGPSKSSKKNIANSQKSEKNKRKMYGVRHKRKVGKSTNVRSLLSDRLRMYSTAEHKAEESGEMKRARELRKDVQLLNALIAHFDSGNIIDPNNIPPEIKSSHSSKMTSPPQQIVTFKESDDDITVLPHNDLDSDASSDSEAVTNTDKILGILRLRRDQYKISVVQNKTIGNVTRALEHLNIIKMFDSAIEHIEMGEKVDLNELPGPPDSPICHLNSASNRREDEQKSTVAFSSHSSFEDNILHSRTLQELQHRLRAYEFLRINAKRENNLGETIRLEQILKLYREAIKLHRARKSVPIDELPAPPGFPSFHNFRTK